MLTRVLFYIFLTTAILSIFVFQNHKNGFEASHHGYLSSHGITLGKSLFSEGQFLMFYQKFISDDERITSIPYNRFPIFPFLMIGATTQLFEPDLAWQILMARQLMNVFFVLAMILSWRAVNELIDNRFASLTVVFLSFSAYYMLYYQDMIFNDTPALFGFALALFLVAANQKQPSSTRYLILIPILSISMGWQPYAVFLSWFVVEAIHFIWVQKLTVSSLKTLFARPASISLITAILWGLMILSFQILNEWQLFDGPFLDIPTIYSIRLRFGLVSLEAFAGITHFLVWENFFQEQALRIVKMFIPFTTLLTLDLSQINLGLTLGFIGVALLLFFMATRRRLSFTTTTFMIFTSSGFFWSLPMKYFVAFHDFQAIFYIGLTLISFAMLLSFIKSKALAVSLAGAACLLFILSVRSMNIQKDEISQTVNPITHDFQAIYEQLPKGSRVFLEGEHHPPTIGFHAFNFLLINTYRVPLEKAEYIISVSPNYGLENVEGLKLLKNLKD